MVETLQLCKSMKQGNKGWHTPKTQKVSGINHGVGIKQPVGKIVSVYGFDAPKGKSTIGKPPKSLA